jgi:hypothetical protein
MGVPRTMSEADTKAAIALGLLPNFFSVHKFGRNPDIDSGTTPETIWEAGGLYPWQASGYTAEVLSSDANDTAAGTGARTVTLIGLDEDFNPLEETVTLNGTTAVDTTNTNWLRIFRAFVATAGSGGANAGAITVRLDGAGATQAQIAAGNNQTTLGLYTTPAGRRGAIVSWEAALLRSGANDELEFGLFTRDNTVADSTFRLRTQIGLRGAGTSTHQKMMGVPITVGEKTDVDVRCTSSDGSNIAVVTSFEMLLIDEAVLS